MKVGKLRVIGSNGIAFWCTACGSYHQVNLVKGEGPVWSFNGDYNRPTFSPSVLVRSGHYIGDRPRGNCWCDFEERYPEEEKPEFVCCLCHSFVVDGKIQYLSDCSHDLAGTIVELEGGPS